MANIVTQTLNGLKLEAHTLKKKIGYNTRRRQGHKLALGGEGVGVGVGVRIFRPPLEPLTASHIGN